MLVSCLTYSSILKLEATSWLTQGVISQKREPQMLRIIWHFPRALALACTMSRRSETNRWCNHASISQSHFPDHFTSLWQAKCDYEQWCRNAEKWNEAVSVSSFMLKLASAYLQMPPFHNNSWFIQHRQARKDTFSIHVLLTITQIRYVIFGVQYWGSIQNDS